MGGAQTIAARHSRAYLWLYPALSRAHLKSADPPLIRRQTLGLPK
jgi:hypothetical protein